MLRKKYPYTKADSVRHKGVDLKSDHDVHNAKLISNATELPMSMYTPSLLLAELFRKDPANTAISPTKRPKQAISNNVTPIAPIIVNFIPAGYRTCFLVSSNAAPSHPCKKGS